MSTIEERTAYKDNPYFTGHVYGNFSPFYVSIAICSVVLGSIIILNIILGCCSKHRKYWQDRHTGNRWLVSIWSATPHLQPPLDFTELKDPQYFERYHYDLTEDIESQKHQFEIEVPTHSAGLRSGHHEPLHHKQNIELQKRESDI